MSLISKNAEQKYALDSITYNAPIDWQDVKIIADYVNDSIQPSLAIEDFTFTGEAREAIIQWIQDGLSGGVGIFEGMPFKLTLFNNTPIQDNFTAYIDFTNGYKELLEDGRVDTKIIKDKGLDNFFEQIDSTTFGFLFSQGAVTFSDFTAIEYVVEKKFNLFDIVLSSVVLYLMTKELAVSIRNTSDQIAEVTRAAGNTPFNVGDLAYNVALALINIAYTTILLLTIIELAKNYIEALIKPKGVHKAITLKRALEVICNYFGYNLITPIQELNNLVYLPSNPNLDTKTTLGFISQKRGVPIGIPNTFDYGYNCGEMFQLAKNLFNAKIAILGNDVHLRSKNDPFWVQQSTWQMPSVLIQTLEYNTNEMKAERLLTFETDINDEWTIDNYNGNAYEIRTSPVTTIRKDAVLLKDIDEVNFRCALPTRKDNTNAIEDFATIVAKFIDAVTGVFGGGTNFTSKFTNKIGVLKQSDNWHSIPKLLYVNNGKLPINHRSLFNAKTLYDNYHNEKSFVLNNWYGQKKVYNNVRIPFGFEDYQQLTNNPYFTFKGKQAKIDKFNWTIGQDFAVIDFWVREPYTYNLKETYYYP